MDLVFSFGLTFFVFNGIVVDVSILDFSLSSLACSVD